MFAELSQVCDLLTLIEIQGKSKGIIEESPKDSSTF